jgi:hypothetical protein
MSHYRCAAIIDSRHDRDRKVSSKRLVGLSATMHCAAMTGALIDMVVGLRTGAHKTPPWKLSGNACESPGGCPLHGEEDFSYFS